MRHYYGTWAWNKYSSQSTSSLGTRSGTLTPQRFSQILHQETFQEVKMHADIVISYALLHEPIDI
jgi:hypothetical protein